MIPVGACPVEQLVGLDASAVAVAAFPVVLWFSVGTSALTSARKVGVAAEPELGPASTIFALCVLSVSVIVPEVVIGEPLALMIDGGVIATDVTVPVPPPPRAAQP